MSSLSRRLSALFAALLLTGALASCGGDNDNPDLNTAAAQTKCEKQEAKDIKSATDAQRSALCKCLLPKLTAAGFKKWNDVNDADKKHDPRLATIGAACVNTVRGY